VHQTRSGEKAPQSRDAISFEDARPLVESWLLSNQALIAAIRKNEAAGQPGALELEVRLMNSQGHRAPPEPMQNNEASRALMKRVLGAPIWTRREPSGCAHQPQASCLDVIWPVGVSQCTKWLFENGLLSDELQGLVVHEARGSGCGAAERAFCSLRSRRVFGGLGESLPSQECCAKFKLTKKDVPLQCGLVLRFSLSLEVALASEDQLAVALAECVSNNQDMTVLSREKSVSTCQVLPGWRLDASSVVTTQQLLTASKQQAAQGGNALSTIELEFEFEPTTAPVQDQLHIECCRQLLEALSCLFD
jgi:hypothetical protein